MRTMCFLVEDDVRSNNKISEVVNKIPCFVEETGRCLGYKEVTVRCRQEDTKTVERLLSSIV